MRSCEPRNRHLRKEKALKELYASFKKSRWFPLVIGILLIVFGFLCITHPKAEMQKIALYLGLAILLYGLFAIVVGYLNRKDKKRCTADVVFGVVLIIIAILDFVNLPLIGKYLPTLAGFAMILCAIADLFRAAVLWKNGNSSWWVGAIVALAVLVIGFIFLLKPAFVGQTIGMFTGVALLLNGISGLISFAQFGK